MRIFYKWQILIRSHDETVPIDPDMFRRGAVVFDHDSGVFSQDRASTVPSIIAEFADPTTHGLRLLQEEK